MNQEQESIQRRKERIFNVMISVFFAAGILFYVLSIITHQNTFDGLATFALVSAIIALVMKDILKNEQEDKKKL